MNVQYDFKKSIGQLLLKSGSITEEMLAFTTKVQQVSRERIGGEVHKLMSAPDPAPAVGTMAQSGVLLAVLPGSDPRVNHHLSQHLNVAGQAHEQIAGAARFEDVGR